jgi:hypothetical protein
LRGLDTEPVGEWEVGAKPASAEPMDESEPDQEKSITHVKNQ